MVNDWAKGVFAESKYPSPEDAKQSFFDKLPQNKLGAPTELCYGLFKKRINDMFRQKRSKLSEKIVFKIEKIEGTDLPFTERSKILEEKYKGKRALRRFTRKHVISTRKITRNDLNFIALRLSLWKDGKDFTDLDRRAKFEESSDEEDDEEIEYDIDQLEKEVRRSSESLVDEE